MYTVSHLQLKVRKGLWVIKSELLLIYGLKVSEYICFVERYLLLY